MRVLKLLCCAAALTVALAPGARADEWDKKTILTFSGPVQIPGATLPAGSYVFKLADIPGNRHVVQVFDKAEKKLFTTMLAIPNERLEASDKPVVLFSERATGSPQAVKVWFYPGNRIGNEFVYPKSQAMRIARETHSSVLATNDDSNTTGTAGTIPDSMKTAKLGRFDETGTWQSDNRVVAVNGNTSSAAPGLATKAPTASETTARADTAPMHAATTTTTNGTSGGRVPRRSLPRTASSLALYELLSGLAMAGAFAARRFRGAAR